jgi:hypothetical protein
VVNYLRFLISNVIRRRPSSTPSSIAVKHAVKHVKGIDGEKEGGER